jgi:hypothetical protein
MPDDLQPDPESTAPGDAFGEALERNVEARLGPPEVRARRNRRFVSRLLRRHPEAEIRAMLKALATLDDPACCENLRRHDLDAGPLGEVIRPFDPLGLRFGIEILGEGRVRVTMGESWEEVGSGGTFDLERLPDGTYRVSGPAVRWLA